MAIMDTIIPDNIDTILEMWEKQDSEKGTITLLHKTGEKHYFFYHPGVQEIKPGCEIPFGMTINVQKERTNFNSHYDVKFHERNISEGKYFILEEEGAEEKLERIVPFMYSNEIPSKVVDAGVKNQIFNYLGEYAKMNMELLDHIGDHGLFSMFKKKKEFKTKSNKYKKQSQELGKSISQLFTEEESPSRVLNPFEYDDEDRGKKEMFLKKSGCPKYLGIPVAIGLFSFLPYSSIEYCVKKIEGLGREASKKSQEKYTDLKIFSENPFVSPKMARNAKRLFEDVKFASNFISYGVQLGLTATAVAFAPQIIGLGAAGITAGTTLTMASNMYKSGGKDSSGMISTYIGKKKFNKLE